MIHLRAEISDFARAVRDAFPGEPAWGVWLERWLAGEERGGKTLAEMREWEATFESTVRQAEAVEGMIVGTNENLSRRWAHALASLLGLEDDQLEPIADEARSVMAETYRRLARVERERLAAKRPQPRLYGGVS